MFFYTHTFDPVPVAPEHFWFQRGIGFALEADFKARCVWYYGRFSGGLIVRSFFHDGGMATCLIRIAEACRQSRWTTWLTVLTLGLVRAFCHCRIGRGAVFGPGLVLLHPFGVFVHTTVRTGVNSILQNSITLGGEDDRGPQLGQNVFVGVGARIIGPVTLGDRSRVGANAVVMASIKEDHVAAGNPARQIPIATGGGHGSV